MKAKVSNWRMEFFNTNCSFCEKKAVCLISAHNFLRFRKVKLCDKHRQCWEHDILEI